MLTSGGSTKPWPELLPKAHDTPDGVRRVEGFLQRRGRRNQPECQSIHAEESLAAVARGARIDSLERL